MKSTLILEVSRNMVELHQRQYCWILNTDQLIQIQIKIDTNSLDLNSHKYHFQLQVYFFK